MFLSRKKRGVLSPPNVIPKGDNSERLVHNLGHLNKFVPQDPKVSEPFLP